MVEEVTDMSVVGEYLHWCIVVVFVAQLLWSLHQDDSSQVVVKQEAKEATDKCGEEAAAAEGRLLTYNLELFLAFVFFRFTNDIAVYGFLCSD